MSLPGPSVQPPVWPPPVWPPDRDRDRDRDRLNRRGVRVVGSGYEPFTIPELILENCNQSDIFAGKLLQQHDWQGRRNQLNSTHHGKRKKKSAQFGIPR